MLLGAHVPNCGRGVHFAISPDPDADLLLALQDWEGGGRELDHRLGPSRRVVLGGQRHLPLRALLLR